MAPIYADVRSRPCKSLKCKPHLNIHIENAAYKCHYYYHYMCMYSSLSSLVREAYEFLKDKLIWYSCVIFLEGYTVQARFSKNSFSRMKKLVITILAVLAQIARKEGSVCGKIGGESSAVSKFSRFWGRVSHPTARFQWSRDLMARLQRSRQHISWPYLRISFACN